MNAPTFTTAADGWHEAAFSSVAELAEFVAATPRGKGAGTRSGRTDDPGFHGTANMAEALELARNGWQAGARDVVRALAARKTAVGARKTGSRSASRYDVSGDDVEMGRFMGGDPECMVSFRRRPTKGRVVRSVNISISNGSGVSGGALMRYAVAVCAAVQRMETSGVRVELWARRTSRASGGGGMRVAVRVKSADSRLHPAALAFACGHPSFQRRLCFGLQERHPAAFIRAMSADGFGCASHDAENRYLTTATFFENDSQIDAAIEELKAAC